MNEPHHLHWPAVRSVNGVPVELMRFITDNTRKNRVRERRRKARLSA